MIFNVSDRNNTKRRHDFQAYLSKEYEKGKPECSVKKQVGFMVKGFSKDT